MFSTYGLMVVLAFASLLAGIALGRHLEAEEWLYSLRKRLIRRKCRKRTNRWKNRHRTRCDDGCFHRIRPYEPGTSADYHRPHPG